MRKSTLVVLALSVLLVVLSLGGCKLASDPDIVGTWSYSVSAYGITESVTYVFSSGGTFTYTFAETGYSTQTYSGTWSGSASPYTLTILGSSTTATVSGNKLTVSGDSITYTKN
jgi:hypothetical protein